MLAASQHTCIPPTNPFQLRSALHGLQMERCTHAAILQTLALPLSAWPHFHAVARLFGVSFDTVFSIYSLEVQTRVLRTNHVVKAGMAQHAQAWLAGGCKAMQWGTLWVLPNRPSVRGCLPPPAASRQLADPPPPPPHPHPAPRAHPAPRQAWTQCSWLSNWTSRPACSCGACWSTCSWGAAEVLRKRSGLWAPLQRRRWVLDSCPCARLLAAASWPAPTCRCSATTHKCSHSRPSSPAA